MRPGRAKEIYHSLHRVLTEVANDVRGVVNANASRATAAASSASDGSHRQKQPRSKRRRFCDRPFVEHEAGVSGRRRGGRLDRSEPSE